MAVTQQTSATNVATKVARRPRIRTAVPRVRVGSAWGIVGRSLPMPRWVLVTTGLAPIVFVGSWLLADLLQPPDYSPIRQSVSVLAGYAGRYRWIVTGALLVVGACYLLTAAGMTRLHGRARVGLLVAGLSGIGIAFCPEPVQGSTSQHLAFTALGAVAIAVWPFLAIRADETWPSPLSYRSSIVVGALFLALLAWTIVETRDGDMLGLAERLSSSIQICWPALVAYGFYRQNRRATVPTERSERSAP